MRLPNGIWSAELECKVSLVKLHHMRLENAIFWEVLKSVKSHVKMATCGAICGTHLTVAPETDQTCPGCPHCVSWLPKCQFEDDLGSPREMTECGEVIDTHSQVSDTECHIMVK